MDGNPVTLAEGPEGKQTESAPGERRIQSARATLRGRRQGEYSVPGDPSHRSHEPKDSLTDANSRGILAFSVFFSIFYHRAHQSLGLLCGEEEAMAGQLAADRQTAPVLPPSHGNPYFLPNLANLTEIYCA